MLAYIEEFLLVPSLSGWASEEGGCPEARGRLHPLFDSPR